jgi:hypothetical protein
MAGVVVMSVSPASDFDSAEPRPVLAHPCWSMKIDRTELLSAAGVKMSENSSEKKMERRKRVDAKQWVGKTTSAPGPAGALGVEV